MKKNNKYLNIKGAVLDNYQLEKYMEKIAINHNTKTTSRINTYPIYRLKENYKFIEKTYMLLNEHIKMNIEIYPAGEWLLDNFYIIEETVKTVTNELTIKKYRNLPSVSNGQYDGFARISIIASEIVAYTDSKIDDDILKIALSSYQKRKTLSMEEIWNLWLFLQIAIIENIREICEKIYLSQIQKYKVESIVERFITEKNKTNQKFRPIKSNIQILNKQMKYPFIEYMSYKLKQYGKQGLPYLNVLEEQVNKMGMTVSEVIKKEHFDIAISKVSLGNSITSIKEILRVNFLNLFEEINGVEDILKKDPSNIYDKMDYKTKEYYRNKIKELSEKTKISEIYITQKALELCTICEGKKSHIGYYLIDKGINQLLRELGQKAQREKNYKIYIYSIYFITTILTVLFEIFINNKINNLKISIILAIILYIPISEICIQIVNYVLNKKVKPKLIPKLNFENGVPKEFSTFVVIPTIIKDKQKVIELMNKLEIYYLANKSDNIYFALLGDCSSGQNKVEKWDKEIIDTGINEANRLNKKYEFKIPVFHFLYREREWNPSEKCYLGWERKRGLLNQFNEFLINGTNNFIENTILNCSEKLNIKYIITLDSDTNLVLNTGLELIGAMAHILNTPVINNEKNIVVEGYGIIQPRVGIDITSSNKSLFTKIYAGLRRYRFIYKCSIRYISR